MDLLHLEGGWLLPWNNFRSSEYIVFSLALCFLISLPPLVCMCIYTSFHSRAHHFFHISRECMFVVGKQLCEKATAHVYMAWTPGYHSMINYCAVIQHHGIHLGPQYVLSSCFDLPSQYLKNLYAFCSHRCGLYALISSYRTLFYR